MQAFDEEQDRQGLAVRHGPQLDIFVKVFAFPAHGGAVGHLMDHAFGIVYYALLFYLSVRVNYFGDSFDTAYKTISKYLNVNKALFRSELYNPYIIGNPLYGIPYAYGYARIVELHEEAEKVLGSKYDQKAFDTQYLSYGPTYFHLLADRLAQWEKAQ